MELWKEMGCMNVLRIWSSSAENPNYDPSGMLSPPWWDGSKGIEVNKERVFQGPQEKFGEMDIFLNVAKSYRWDFMINGIAQ